MFLAVASPCSWPERASDRYAPRAITLSREKKFGIPLSERERLLHRENVRSPPVSFPFVVFRMSSPACLRLEKD